METAAFSLETCQLVKIMPSSVVMEFSAVYRPIYSQEIIFKEENKSAVFVLNTSLYQNKHMIILYKIKQMYLKVLDLHG